MQLGRCGRFAPVDGDRVFFVVDRAGLLRASRRRSRLGGCVLIFANDRIVAKGRLFGLGGLMLGFKRGIHHGAGRRVERVERNASRRFVDWVFEAKVIRGSHLLRRCGRHAVCCLTVIERGRRRHLCGVAVSAGRIEQYFDRFTRRRHWRGALMTGCALID
jgi:hypothetical protein